MHDGLRMIESHLDENLIQFCHKLPMSFEEKKSQSYWKVDGKHTTTTTVRTT